MINFSIRLTNHNLFQGKHFCKCFRRNKTASSADYCLDLVKRHDYENFMCTLLLSNAARANALAVRSFNVEISRISEQVSQATTGTMRLKFWEDVIDRCFTKDSKHVPQHPVAIELFKAVTSAPLTKRYFKTLITSRAQFLNASTFTSLEEAESYAERTVSNVFYLLLEGAGVKNIHADHAASHLGKAQGIVQQLRCIPLARRLNFIGIPQDVLVRHKVSQEEVLRAKQSERLGECCFELASHAHQHLMKARSLQQQVPAPARGVLLPAITVETYLNRLQNVQHDVFHKSLQHRSWKWLPKLWLTHFRNMY